MNIRSAGALAGGEQFDAKGDFYDKYHDRRVRFQGEQMLRVNP